MIWSVICTFSDSGHGSTGHIIPYYTILYLLDPFGYWPFDLYPLLSGRAPALQAPGIAKASRDLAAVEVLWPVSSLRPFPVGGTQPSRDDLRHGEHVRQSLKRAI